MASERLDATNAVFGVCRQTRYRALLEVEKELKEVAKASKDVYRGQNRAQSGMIEDHWLLSTETRKQQATRRRR
jgi:hypothetical protein